MRALNSAASDLFEVAYEAPSSRMGYLQRREPYWVTHEWEVSSQAGSPSIAEHLIPAGLRRALEKRRAEEIERALDESTRRRRTSEASVAYRLGILDGCRRDLGLLSSRLEDEDAPMPE